MAHIDCGNLTTAAFGYDGRGMIGSVQHKRAGGDVLAARTYVRDSRDRITSFQKGINPGVNLMEVPLQSLLEKWTVKL